MGGLGLLALFHVLVALPAQAQSVQKPLYLYTPVAPDLSRTPPVGVQDDATLSGGDSATWTLNPTTAADLTLAAGDITIVLYLRRVGNPGDRTVTVALDYTGPSSGSIGSDTQTLALGASPTPEVFTINLPADLTLAAGSAIVLTVTNDETGPNLKIRVHPNSGGGNSVVNLNSDTYVNVEGVVTYDAAYPGGSPVTGFLAGTTAYIRATLSDPFGSYDITGALVDVLDPFGVPVVSGAPMTEVFDSGAATKLYEYAFAIPPGGPDGIWTADVTAIEGTEGTVTDLGSTTFGVGPPDLVVMKTVTTIDDPVNGSTNPKAIPGANVLYTIRVTNQGFGPVDSDTLAITDALPPELEMFVNDVGGPGSGPVLFVDGSPTSGLTYTFGGLGDGTDDLDFDDGGGAFAYTPTPGVDGYDPNVVAIRASPKGTFNGTTGAGSPYFELRLRARVR